MFNIIAPVDSATYLFPAPTMVALDGRYAPTGFSTSSYVYNSDGSVASATDGGVTTTYTYNADGSIATDTRGSVTRTYTYTNGNLTGIA